MHQKCIIYVQLIRVTSDETYIQNNFITKITLFQVIYKINIM